MNPVRIKVSDDTTDSSINNSIVAVIHSVNDTDVHVVGTVEVDQHFLEASHVPGANLVKPCNQGGSLSITMGNHLSFIFNKSSFPSGGASTVLGLKVSNSLFSLSLELSLVLGMLVTCFNNFS